MSRETEYRIYLLGPDGHIVKSDLVSAEHDDEALLKAIRTERACELWEGQRFIAAIGADGSITLKSGYRAR